MKLNSCLLIVPYTIISFFITSCYQEVIGQPHTLRVSEGFVNPIGFYDHEPTFSWNLPVSETIKIFLLGKSLKKLLALFVLNIKASGFFNMKNILTNIFDNSPIKK